MAYRVTATWIVEAETADEAVNAIENAVAKDGNVIAELDDSEAEEEE